MPEGHCRRGATSTPGRESRSRAASASAVATSRLHTVPVQTSQRPHGAADGSSSWRRRNTMRHSVVSRYSSIAFCSATRASAMRRCRSRSYDPFGAGADPAALDPLGGAVGVEHLEQHLQPGARQVDPRLDRRRGQRCLRQHGERLPHERLGRERERGEVRPDVAVLVAGQQHHLGPLDRTARPADLLVVRHRRGGRAEVHDEPEIGLVEPHAERARGDQRLHPVGQQIGLGGEPLLGLGLAGVGGDAVAALAQELRHVLGGLDRERVDDARAGQLGEPGREPARAARPACAASRPTGAGSPGRASRAGRAAAPEARPSCSVTSTTTRSFAVAVVASTGMPGGSSPISAAQPPVVGPEVVPPVGHAVRLVDHEHARRSP